MPSAQPISRRKGASLRAESGPKGIASGRTGVRAEAEVATRLMIECLRRKAKAPESPVVCASVNTDIIHLALQAWPRHADRD